MSAFTVAKEQLGAQASPPAPTCPVKIVVFTVKLLIGLAISQAVPGWLAPDEYDKWQLVVKLMTMFCLSFIMINVGYEFDIDKSKMGQYGSDYCIAMTAAGFPWIFVALWFVYVLPDPLPMSRALIAARFAAPTSAGILFSMLEAAGMKETWLFQKARVLAIFDDLDTILLMVPLKVIIVGLKWELSIDLFFVVVLLGLSFRYLHVVKIPVSWTATLLYAALVTILCESVHVLTHYHIEAMDTVHLEVLLPAFAIGCVARSGHAANRHDSLKPPAASATVVTEAEIREVEADSSSRHESSVRSCTGGTFDQDLEVCETSTNDSKDCPRDSGSNEPKPPQRLEQEQPMPAKKRPRKGFTRRMSVIVEDMNLTESENIATGISAFFMVLVGLSMPALLGGDSSSEGETASNATASNATASNATLGSSDGGGSAGQMPAGELMGHVAAVTILMIIGKMFPTFCYRSEANLRTRFALSLGMCPRGEVGAGVIVISLGFGIKGSAITIAVIALAINLILSSGFIMAVKHLACESSFTKVVPFTAADQGPEQVNEDKNQVHALNIDELCADSKETPVPTGTPAVLL